jgi:hypothetical protein
MPRGEASFVGLDFPRTISRDIDKHSVRLRAAERGKQAVAVDAGERAAGCAG